MQEAYDATNYVVSSLKSTTMALRGKVDRAILTRAFETVQQGTLIVTKLENLLFSEVADLKDQEVKESLIEARKV